LTGPTIYSAGQALDGDPPTGPFQRALASVDEAIAVVEEQHDAGYDFVKVYDALDVERHGAIIDRATELGLAVFGHVPEAIGVEGTLASGQAVVTHAEEFYPAIEKATDLESAIASLANEVRRSGVIVIPNGAFVKGLVLQLENLEQQLSQPGVEYLAPAVRVWWEPRYNYYVNRDNPEGFMSQSRARHAWIRKLVRELDIRGVMLLAGSDASIPVALPGPSLHQELCELVESGLSNYDALRTATVNVEAFMSAHCPERGVFGTITVGRRADLVVLEENPLESLQALGGVTGVVLRGKWFATSTLRDLRDRDTRAFRSEEGTPK
jgi:imidazolonepropionase-like amidohydrolase